MTTSAPTTEPESDFIRQLLDEQAQLTAVEQFSAASQAGQLTDDPAQARYYQSLLPATQPSPGQQYSFEVDLDACSGCKACVVACHTLNGLEEDESWRRVGAITIGGPEPEIRHVTTACHHCEDPGCLNGCPVMAYEKDPLTGIVRHLDDQCIGCKYCTMTCPYEVPQYSSRLGIVRKCDMCQQRLSVGEAPACVQACPNEAIAIRLVDIQSKEFPAGERLAPGAPVSTLTRPSTSYVGAAAEQMASAGTPHDAMLDTPAESHWPLAAMLVATQISVGILVVERTAALVTNSTASSFTTQTATLAALILCLVGMGVAPLHLGQPLRAWRVFLGLKTSWLSREAVLLGQYAGLLALTTTLLWMPRWPFDAPEFLSLLSAPWVANLALGLTLATGLAALFSSAMIYIVTGRLLWRRWRTLLRFLGTAVVAGPAWLAGLLAFTGESPQSVPWWLLASAWLVGAKFTWEWTILLGRERETDAETDRRSRRLVARQLPKLKWLRVALAIGSCGLLAGAGLLGSAISPSLTALVIGIALLLLTAGEYCERLLYFSSVVYDRMPGALR